MPVKSTLVRASRSRIAGTDATVHISYMPDLWVELQNSFDVELPMPVAAAPWWQMRSLFRHGVHALSRRRAA